MNDERDDLLREIGEALSAEPTLGFAGRVHAAIEANRKPWVSWWWVSAAAGSAALVVATLTMGQRQLPLAAPVTPRAEVTANSAAPPLEPAIARNASTISTSPSSPPAGSPRLLRAARREFTVVIPPDQVYRFRRLVSDLREGRVEFRGESSDLTEPPIMHALGELPPVQIPDIEIAPSLFFEPLVEPLVEG